MNNEEPNLKKAFVITLGDQVIKLEGHTKQNELIVQRRCKRWKTAKIKNLNFHLI